MRLERLDLEFFGHFSGKSLDFGAKPKDSDFHVIFGPNEAGKTTVMEGYLRLLYGFPPREAYAFKHDRAALRVSGTVQIGDASTAFTRLPSRTANLVDANGTALPDTALSQALAGLSMTEYRNLLCLDDETIEKGGDQIAASEGKVGELLFSTASGIMDIAALLDEARKEADTLYLKGGSKSDFAQLRRSYDQVTKAIKEGDVSASAYRKLCKDVDEAEAQEAAIRAELLEKRKAVESLRALADALPIKAEIARIEAELDPLSAYPARLEVDTARLRAVMSERAALVAERATVQRDVMQAKAARVALDRNPELASQAETVEALRDLRGRCYTAALDLPNRLDERRRLREAMAEGLRAIGVDGGETPEALMPSADVLDRVEELQQAARTAQAKVDDAKAEGARALEEARDAKARLDAAKTALSKIPDTGPILDQMGAQAVLDRVREADATQRRLTSSRNRALADLSVAGHSFDALPAIALREAEGRALAEQIARAKADIDAGRSAVQEAKTTADRIKAQIEALEATPGLVTDAAAEAARSARDTAWSAHRETLNDVSADAFEQAMASDDEATAARLTQARDIGEIRQLKAQLADANATAKSTAAALRATDAAAADLDTRLQAHLSAAGLPGDVSAEAFTDWLRKRDLAAEAQAALDAAARDAAADLQAGADLRAALATALGRDAPLESLVTEARSAAEDRARHQIVLETETRAAQADSDQAALRAETLHAAATTNKGAQVALRQLRRTPPFDAVNDLDLAVRVFRRLRELDVARRDLQGRIDRMSRDADALASALAPLLGDAPKDPVAAYDDLAARIAAATQAEADWTRAGERIEALETQTNTLDTSLARLDAEVAAAAQGFGEAVITESSIEAVLKASETAQVAIGLRAQRDAGLQRLYERLGVPDRTAAEARLAEVAPDALRADLGQAETELAAFEPRLTEALEARIKAQQARDAVTGADDIARLTARRTTLELEMEAVLQRHLELQLGALLAETALRRYRDRHRSAMMQAAEAAFRDLTGGKYGRLTTLNEKGNEILVAIRAEDERAVRIGAETRGAKSEFSKGTRFQLYLALRDAAYHQMVSRGTVLPFWCDDVFETFDETRTQAACRLMQRIGKVGQSIYLTHHQHVVDIAKEICGDAVTVHQL